MNVLFFVLFCLSLILLLFSAPESVLPTLLTAAERALTLCFSVAALYCVWMGITNLLSAAGVHRKLARLFRPLLRFLLGETEEESAEFITLNLSSNLLGLGSAATPAGLEAVKRMEQALQAAANNAGATAAYSAHGKNTEAAALSTAAYSVFSARLWYEHQTTALFLLNTCMLQLLPTGIISLRASLGSSTPTDVLLPSLICGAFSLAVAVFLIRLHKGWTVRRICDACPTLQGKKGDKK